MKYLPALVVVLLCGCSNIWNPKYKVGDCVALPFDSSSERWEHRTKYQFSRKIVEIGKSHYLGMYWKGADEGSLAESNTLDGGVSLWFVNTTWIQIDCNTLERK